MEKTKQNWLQRHWVWSIVIFAFVGIIIGIAVASPTPVTKEVKVVEEAYVTPEEYCTTNNLALAYGKYIVALENLYDVEGLRDMEDWETVSGYLEENKERCIEDGYAK